jgi:hypothetical protein
MGRSRQSKIRACLRDVCDHIKAIRMLFKANQKQSAQLEIQTGFNFFLDWAKKEDDEPSSHP